jgi:hypothetical protein
LIAVAYEWPKFDKGFNVHRQLASDIDRHIVTLMYQKNFVVTENILFDFELFIGGRCELVSDTNAFFHIKLGIAFEVYLILDPVLRQAIDTMSTDNWLRIRIVGKQKKNTE